jgi:dihydropteroate synthase-like protein
MNSMNRENLHFVTGRLAEHALRAMLEQLAPQVGFRYSIDVLPITVAALMTPDWIARRIQIPGDTTRVLIPGYCAGELDELNRVTKVPVERGPRDLRELPEFFGEQRSEQYGDFEIEILAEINNAPRLSRDEILRQATRYRDNGADVIDIGCDPGLTWSGVGDCVKALKDEGFRVSIDSLNSAEIEAAVQAGAELVLSVNSANRSAALFWDCEVVAIPDHPATLAGLDTTLETLAKAGMRVRIDPILEPIGCGFAASLGRYFETRRRYPDAEMIMGIGNLTELTDVDSAGLNVLLLGICQELGIRSVLTTEVINWARSSVKECDLARRLVHFAITNKVPPKHLEPNLVMLRDSKLHEHGADALAELASHIKDNSYRLFAERGELHLLGANLQLSDTDPFMLFERLMATSPKNIDPQHAFYLGFELAKALTALTLGKEYRQDEALDWGFLTVPETSHRLTKRPP